MNYYKEIKEQIINNEITKKVKDYSKNRSDLNTYYSVGKLLNEAGKHYGEGIIKEYSKRLTKEIGKNYSVRILYKMLKYYNFMSKNNLPTVSAKLSWSQYDEILKLDDIDEIKYYINLCYQQNLSVRELRNRIKNNEYERLPEETKDKIINNLETTVQDFIKNPIIIKNKNNYDVVSEKILQKLILEDIPSFLKELGTGFTFIENEYKIKIGSRYNYIDLRLYNIKFKCYVIIELKTTELKKEHIGQIQTYMNYIDKNIKTIDEDKTIGIIICKKDNKFIMEYCSDKRILAKEYELI